MAEKLRLFVSVGERRFLVLCKASAPVSKLAEKVASMYQTLFKAELTVSHLYLGRYLIPSNYRVGHVLSDSDLVYANSGQGPKKSRRNSRETVQIPPDEPHKRIRLPSSDSSVESDGVFDRNLSRISDGE